MDEEWDQKARDALIRMSKAYHSGKGVRISWEELEVLYRTVVGSIWADVEFTKGLTNK
jgi:hypothetical protein